MERPGKRVVAALVGSALLLAAGCSSGDDPDKIQTIDKATAAESPPLTTTPAGDVAALPFAVTSTTIDPITQTLIVTGDDGNRIELLGTDPAAPPREVSTEHPVRQVTPVGDGTALLAMNGQVGRLDLRTAEVTSTPVDGDVLTVSQLEDGRILAGTDNGTIDVVDPETSDTRTVTGLASVDALAVVGDTVTALDRKQTSVTDIDIDGESLGAALRAGEGAHSLATDSFGRILVTDTPGDELLVYTTDSLTLRQRFPVGPAPVGVAFDETTGTVWVTLSGTNEVVGFELSSGVGVETARFPTVRQPNSIAVDSGTGVVFVGSAAGEGLQRIPTRTAP
ncbi:YncE family protein [Rhodococcus sp. NPDC058521]|uniref:YncE family protein n=1 Tax=Rhodococcus sp. NPDC058521 TaxID=3346536 RepID=UPI00364F59D0